MYMKHILIVCALLCAFSGLQAQSRSKQDKYPATKKVRVYFLGGQSNMKGFGYVKELPASFKMPEDVYIFDGNDVGDGQAGAGQGRWEPLRPGHGSGFSVVDGKNRLSDRFGAELSLAQALREQYPHDRIALIKYARNGTSIDSQAAGSMGCWDPAFLQRENQYAHCLSTLRQAFAHTDLDGDGQLEELVPAGICWMQGESDGSFGQDVALRYQQHLGQLMSHLRAALLDAKLPVVIGKISDSGLNDRKKVWAFTELVQHAQEQYVASDPHAAIIRDTMHYGYSDPHHYDTKGYLSLGRRFAEALIALGEQPVQ